MDKLKFAFSLEETNLILQGLFELPVKVSMELIGKIKKETQSQIAEKQEEAKE